MNLKIIKKIFFTIIIGIVLLIFALMGFINLAPQFGASPSGKHLDKIIKSNNYGSDQFQNQILTTMDLGMKNGAKVMYEFMFSGKGRAPESPLPAIFSENGTLNTSAAKFTWYGHSAILLEINGLKIMMDPMLGPAASPVSFMTKRFAYKQPIDLNSIPDLDAVILSHDHYDHLDYPSILALKDRVSHFYTPLGVSAHLIKWGVDSSKITELDWWEQARIDDLSIVATPARHFSGRGLTDRNKTQWASWVILSEQERIYFSGDSGYGPHFKEIGEKYGPFDFAMMECGQYDPRWEAIHMMPEQTVQASLDLCTKNMMPIHWGAFNLSLHQWTDPVERVLKASKDKNVKVVTPIIGEQFSLNETLSNQQLWWRNL